MPQFTGCWGKKSDLERFSQALKHQCSLFRAFTNVFQRSRPPCAAMARASRSFMCSSCDWVEKMRHVVAPKRPPPIRVDARGHSQMAHLWVESRLPFEHEDKRNLLGTGFPRMCNALYLRLKWLHRPVQCSRFVLTRGEIELCESSSSLQVPVNAPRPH